MVDKSYCMSSYLAFRYIFDKNMDFSDSISHADDEMLFDKVIPVRTAEDISNAYNNILREYSDVKLGLLLSGGMDSACVAAHLKPGTDAYTFRYLNGEFENQELNRAEQYANKYHLNLHYVDIGWDTVKKNLPILMKRKGMPVHSIEPQIMEAALYAKSDGVEMVVVADSSDMVFGGLDKMLSKDWKYDEWVEFYTFCKPEEVLNEPVDIYGLFEEYRLDDDLIDFQRFIREVYSKESLSSYCNACICADMKYKPFLDPSALVKMSEPLDLNRIRNGESKYLIRELFKMCYPGFEIPEKIPMPRPVDVYFQGWDGPKRKEFRSDLDINHFTGNQKWQIWCLEEFLNMIDRK